MAIPKLRFKDFGEDWTAKKLSQVANLTSSKRVHLSDYVSEGIPFFRGKEITELKSGIFPKDILYISKKQYEDFKEKFGAPQNNEILMTAVGTLANTYLINTDFEFYFKDGNLIWFKDINADPNFLMILLDARKNDVLASAIGSTQKALTIANLNKLIFNFPSNKEQIKITSFLSAVDEKIRQLTQKYQLLSQYKQGMMQKLFSQQIRFKADDGSEFEEWKQTVLSDIFKIKAGGDIDKESVSEIKTEEFCYPIFANSDKNKGFYGWANKFKYTEAVTVTGRGNLGIAVARYEPFYPIVRLLILLPLNKQSLKFFEEQINQLDIVSESTGVPQLTAPQLSKYQINVPCLEEQTKIANFLSSLDQKIEVVAQQIEQTKTWKKGLLQQMFI